MSISDPTLTIDSYDGDKPICSLHYPYTDVSHNNVSDPFYILNVSKTANAGGNNSEVSKWSASLSVGIKKINATKVRVGWYLYHYFPGLGGYNASPGLTLFSDNNVDMKLFVCSF